MERLVGLNEGIEEKRFEPSDETLSIFLNISPEKLASIRERLASVEGHLRIWVHPLYTEQKPETTRGRLGDTDLTEVQEKLRNTFFRTTESVVRNVSSSPLVVYEAINQIEKTKELIADNLGCAVSELEERGIVFIPTEAMSSSIDTGHLINALNGGNDLDTEEAEKITSYCETILEYIAMSKTYKENLYTVLPGLAENPPYMLEDSDKKLYSELQSQRQTEIGSLLWEYHKAQEDIRTQRNNFMVALYKKLGVKSALVSGAYLEVGENPKTKQPELHACAGAVVNYLREAKFATDISNNIWPPKELIKQAGFEIKQTG